MGVVSYIGVLQYNDWSNLDSGHIYSVIELKDLSNFLDCELNAVVIQ